MTAGCLAQRPLHLRRRPAHPAGQLRAGPGRGRNARIRQLATKL